MGAPKTAVIKHSDAALAVFNAMHEAARRIAAKIEDHPSPEAGVQAAVASAMWCAVTKFVGKALTSLAVANVFARTGAWAADGDSAWTDCTTRFGDALAAAFKVLVHLVSQGFAERLIASNVPAALRLSDPQAQADAEIEPEEPNQPKPRKLSSMELREPSAIATRILQVMAYKPETKRLLMDGGVKEKINTGDTRLRWAKDTVGAKAEHWQTGIRDLSAREILVADGNGAWKLGTSATTKAALLARGLPADIVHQKSA